MMTEEVEFEDIEVEKWQGRIPSGISTDQKIFQEIFSLETWNNVLSEDQRERILQKLPKSVLSTEGAVEETITDFFSNKLSAFGRDPLTNFFCRLEMGHYDPEVVQTKALMMEKWKEESFRQQRAYHVNLHTKLITERPKLAELLRSKAKTKKLTPHNGTTAKSDKKQTSGVAKKKEIDTKRGKKRPIQALSPPIENGTISSDDDVVIISPAKKKATGSQNKKQVAPKGKSTPSPSSKKPKKSKILSSSAQSSPLPVSVLPIEVPKPKNDPPSGIKLAKILPVTTTASLVQNSTSMAKSSPILASQLQAPVSINLNVSPMLDSSHSFNSSSCITLNYPNKTSDKSSEEDENESSSDEFETIEPTIGFNSETTRISLSPGRPVLTQAGQVKTTLGSKNVVVLNTSGAQVTSAAPRVVLHHTSSNSAIMNSSSSSGIFIPSSSGAKIPSTLSFTSTSGTHNKILPLSLQHSSLKKRTNNLASLLPAELLSQLQNNVAASGSFGSSNTVSSTGTTGSTNSVLDTGLSSYLPNRSTNGSIKCQDNDGDLNLSGDFAANLNAGLINLAPLDAADKMEIDGMDKIDDLSVLDGNPFDSIPNLSDELDGLDLDMVDDLCDFESLLSEEKQYSSFFSLIRDVICSTKDHRMTLLMLQKTIKKWSLSAAAAFNDWFGRVSDWSDALVTALNFLAGNYQDCQPEEFVPYIEYKYKTKYYQWIGAGRDGDNNLTPLCNLWMGNLDRLPPLKKLEGDTEEHEEEDEENEDSDATGEDAKKKSKRAITPPPPRFVTSWTVRSSTEEEKIDYQSQERRRYENPHKAFTYQMHGYESVVGPVKGVYSSQSGMTNKARGHSLLVDDRPPYVTILSLVRDAVSRLPNGEGTRSDICELLRDSAFLAAGASNHTLNSVVSGALDRLHYERDPCVRYDSHKKNWIYLHRDRTQEQFERIHHNRSFSKSTKSRNTSSRKSRKNSNANNKNNQSCVGGSSSSDNSFSSTSNAVSGTSTSTVTTIGETTSEDANAAGTTSIIANVGFGGSQTQPVATADIKPALGTQLLEALQQQPELGNILPITDISKSIKFEVAPSSSENSTATTSGSVTSAVPTLVAVSSAGSGKTTLSLGGSFMKQIPVGQQQQTQFILKTTPGGLRAVNQNGQQIQMAHPYTVGEGQRVTAGGSAPTGVVNTGSVTGTPGQVILGPQFMRLVTNGGGKLGDPIKVQQVRLQNGGGGTPLAIGNQPFRLAQNQRILVAPRGPFANNSNTIIIPGGPNSSALFLAPTTSNQTDANNPAQISLNAGNVGITSPTVSSSPILNTDGQPGGIAVLKPVTSTGNVGNLFSMIVTSQQSGAVSSTVTEAKPVSSGDGTTVNKSFTVVPSTSVNVSGSGQQQYAYSFINGSLSASNTANTIQMFQQALSQSMNAQLSGTTIKAPSGKSGEILVPLFNTLNHNGLKVVPFRSAGTNQVIRIVSSNPTGVATLVPTNQVNNQNPQNANSISTTTTNNNVNN